MRIGKILPGCLLLCLCLRAVMMQENKDKVIENKIETLLSKMTLEEKIGQMNQISSLGNIEEMSVAIKKVRLALSWMKLILFASMRCNGGCWGITHGHSFVDCAWWFMVLKLFFLFHWGRLLRSTLPLQKRARVAAIEASAVGIRWTFAPMIDIARDPRWGRIAEGCGRRYVSYFRDGRCHGEGFQGDSLNDPTAIAACPKHFVGYGAAEGGRDYNSTFHSRTKIAECVFAAVWSCCKGRCRYVHDFF